MEELRGKEGLRNLARKCDEEMRDIEWEAKAEMKRVMNERYDAKHLVHINIVTNTEMKAHAKEMRAEMDRKFVECLMAIGTTKGEALGLVHIWNAKE